MINIYLCEDDQVQLDCWKNRIEKYLMIHNMDMELFCWTKDPLVLLTFLEKSECVGLYFIDIDLNADMNGLELAVKYESMIHGDILCLLQLMMRWRR